MIHLKRFSLLVLLVLFGVFIFAQGSEIPAETCKDANGEDIILSGEKDLKSKTFNLKDCVSFTVDYDGDKVDYSGLKGVGGDDPKIKTSEFGKIVEAKFKVDRNRIVVIGNMELELEAGSVVEYKDGKLSITESDKLIDPKEVSFIDNEEGFGTNEISMTGSGVAKENAIAQGLELGSSDTVYLDGDGYFLRDPSFVTYQDLIVSGEGKVYFEDTGEASLDVRDKDGKITQKGINGAYVSVNREKGKFTIGSNQDGNDVWVEAVNDNAYGLEYDDSNDYAAFKVRGVVPNSYVSVSDRTAQGLVSDVDANGFFYIDNDGKSIYSIGDSEILQNLKGNAIYTDASGTETQIPLDISFGNTNKDSPVFIGFGNDGAMGLGSNPEYILADKYATSELRHGVSNRLDYNYYEGGSGVIEQIFGINILGDREYLLDDPQNGKRIIDTLFQLKPEAVDALVNLEFSSNIGTFSDGSSFAGLAHSNGLVQILTHNEINDFTTKIASHEIGGHLGETFSGYFGLDTLGQDFYVAWTRAGGYDFHTSDYGFNGGEEISTFVEYAFMPDSFWQQYGASHRASFVKQAAVATQYGLLSPSQGKRIINANGGDVRDLNSEADFSNLV